MRRLITTLFTSALILATTPAGAAEIIATIKTLTGQVLIEREGQVLPAELGQALYPSDVLRTEDSSSTGMIFNDDTRIAIGPNSTFELSAYQFDEDSGLGDAELNIKTGSLAAIAGRLIDRTPESLRVRTPTAVIAVRGTEFAVQVQPPVAE